MWEDISRCAASSRLSFQYSRAVSYVSLMLLSVSPSFCVELKRFEQDVERKLWQETINTDI